MDNIWIYLPVWFYFWGTVFIVMYAYGEEATPLAMVTLGILWPVTFPIFFIYETSRKIWDIELM